MKNFEHASSDWRAEVDDVAADLVEGGMVPWQAMQRAVEIVQSSRRKRRASRPLPIIERND